MNKSPKQLLKELEHLNDQLDIQISACGCADSQTLCEYLAVNEEYQLSAMNEFRQRAAARSKSAVEYRSRNG